MRADAVVVIGCVLEREHFSISDLTAQFEVTLKGDAFTPAEIKVPAGKAFTMKFFNKETAAAEISI